MKTGNKFLERLCAAVLLAVAFVSFAPASSYAQKDIDPARLAAAKELLVVMGAAKQFDSMLPIMMRQFEDLVVKMKPDKASLIKQIFESLPEKLSKRKQGLLNDVAALYAQKLTTEEMNEIVGFYKTPVGVKLVQFQPELAQESARIGQAWAQSLSPEILAEVQKELEARGQAN